ncbi:MAG: rhodanese-like domain-containing protein [Acidimicrobiales bacterium]
MFAPRSLAAVLVALLTLASACGGSSSDATASPDAGTSAAAADDSASEGTPGVRVVSVDDALAIAENPPADLVILDVRTADEFAEGHLEGAMMIDFYAEDFAAQLGELDPTVPYLLYCRSGNRSGQAAAMMADLGFVDVADVDGGISAWTGKGFPVVK